MNAADAKQVKEAERRERDALALERNDLLWIMEQPQGRRFMARLLESCKFRKTVFDPSGSITNYNLGSQAIAFKLTEAIQEVCFHLWQKMEKEINDKEVNQNV